jgi:hypothetical protein
MTSVQAKHTDASACSRMGNEYDTGELVTSQPNNALPTESIFPRIVPAARARRSRKN